MAPSRARRLRQMGRPRANCKPATRGARPSARGEREVCGERRAPCARAWPGAELGTSGVGFAGGSVADLVTEPLRSREMWKTVAPRPRVVPSQPGRCVVDIILGCGVDPCHACQSPKVLIIGPNQQALRLSEPFYSGGFTFRRTWRPRPRAPAGAQRSSRERPCTAALHSPPLAVRKPTCARSCAAAARKQSRSEGKPQSCAVLVSCDAHRREGGGPWVPGASRQYKSHMRSLVRNAESHQCHA